MKTGIKTMEDGIMKKSLYIAASLLVLAACTRETDIDVPAGDMTITAKTETSADTRTVVEGETHVYWEPGDEIAVFDGVKNRKFTTDITTPSASATFNGTLGDDAWTEGMDLWAVYPYSKDAVFFDETITTVLPSEQVARAGSFGKDLNLAVAHSTTSDLQFFNVGGGVCFTLSEEGIQKVVLESLNGELLAGTVKVAFVDELPVVKAVTGGSTTVTLAAPKGESLETGVLYYMVAIPGALEKGFRFSFHMDGQVGQKVFPSPVTVKRGIYGSLTKVDEGASYVPDTDDNINFKDTRVKEIVVRYFDTGKDGELSYKEAAAVRSFLVDEAQTRSDDGKVSVFAGTDIATFDEITYFTGMTKIEEGVFSNCTQLMSITIPATIIEIGANALKGCTNIQSITVLSETPPTIGEGAFTDTNNCPIIVPAGKTESYVAAWSEYAPRIEGAQPDNEIWYTTSDGEIVALSETDVFRATLISNEYKEGKGVLIFDGAVTEIGSWAFADQSTLTSISIPPRVTSLGIGALCYSGVTSITIPKSVAAIGQYAFSGCNELVSMQLAPENPVFDSREDCNAIIETSSNTLIAGCQNTTIPESVTSLGDYAFQSCYKLTRITIPQSVTSLGDGVFQECTGLTDITLPDGLKSVSNNAFGLCENLSEVHLPEGVVSLGRGAFASCKSLSDILLPESLTTIGPAAFSSCSGLSSVAIPKGITSIGSSAFFNCSSLEKITIQAISLPQGESGMFDRTNDCPIYVPTESLLAYANADIWNNYRERIRGIIRNGNNIIRYKTTDGAVVTPQDYYSEEYLAEIVSNEYVDGTGVMTFDGGLWFVGDFSNATTLKEISIPEEVTTIGSLGFYRCSNLEALVIPASVTTIGNAFEYCSALNSLSVSPSNPVYDSRENCNAIIETATHTLITGSGSTTIPSSVTRIGAGAFNGRTCLARIVIPDNVTEIGELAFNYCSGLTEITLPRSLTSLGRYTFYGCSSLTGISLPEGLTSIGECAFQNCYSLTMLTVPESVVTIGNQAFFDCYRLTEVNVLPETPPTAGSSIFRTFTQANSCPIYVPSSSVEAYKSAEGWRDYADRIKAIPSSSFPIP